MIQKTQGKIDYSTKHGIMVGYIDGSQNVVAVESGWDITPEEMAKFLTEKFSTKEQAIEAVDGVTLIPTFKKTTIGMWMDLVMLLNLIYRGTKT